MSTAATEPTPDFAALAREVVHDLPASPEESLLQGRIFDLRRTLVEQLLDHSGAADHADAADDEEGLRRQDTLREALPPLSIVPGPYVPVFSAWRSAVLAVLGLLLGSALGQGILGLGAVPMAAGVVVVCGMAGVGASLKLAEVLVRAGTQDRIQLPFGSFGVRRLRRLCSVGWLALLVLSLVRDFLAGREVLGHVLGSLGAFLSRGDTLALFSTMYGALAAVALFALCLKRPLLLDKEAFAERVTLAAGNWWGGAACAARALEENARLRKDDKTRQWREVGADLYSLAGELPPAKKEWMEEKLRKLGLEAPRHEGLLIWGPELRERYEVLGHLAPGDACYVDEPPLLENGQLLRKGTVRKVRQ